MPPKRQTHSVAGQQPAQQQDTRHQHRVEQAGDVPATLYDIDLRNIPLGDDMPALSDNAQLCLTRERITDVLCLPVGCTVEALVVDTLACCKSYDAALAVQRLPWWPRAVQMRSLVAAGTLTLGHWAALSEDDRGSVPAIRDMLEQLCGTARKASSAAARRGGVTTELILQRKDEARERALVAADLISKYVSIVRVQNGRSRVRADSALQAATAMRGQVTATVVATQPQQQDARDKYGQTASCEQVLSDDDGWALYDSVYNATWGALQYTADGAHAKTPLAAEDVVLPIVPCGMSPDTLVMDDSSVAAAQRASTAHDVLTLYSPLGWPAMWELATLREPVPSSDEVARRVTAASAAQQLGLDSIDYKNTLFVRGEVQRVWQCIVCARDVLQHLRYGSATTQGTAAAAAAAHARAQGEQGDDAAEAPAQVQGKAQTQGKHVVEDTTMRPHVLVRGTPGIGKTLPIGGYVLYKLLHEEGERALPYVLFEVNGLSFVFDKRNKTVACYKRKSFDAGDFVRAVDSQCARIFDCSERIAYDEDHYDDIGEINIVLTSPNVKNTEDFLRRLQSDDMIYFCTMHAWTLREMLLVGRYVGMTPDMIVERVRHVGPLPRYILTKTDKYTTRMSAITRAASNKSRIKKLQIPLCVVHDVVFDDPQNPTNVLYDMRRETDAFYDVDSITERTESGARVPQKAACEYRFVPLSPYIYDILTETMTNKAKQNKDYLASVLATCAAHPGALEYFVLQSLTYKSFWQLCAHAVGKKRKYCKYMPRGGDGAAADEPDTPLCNAAMQAWMAGLKEHDVVYFDDNTISVTFDVQHKLRVFVPRSRAFPLVDAFVLVYYAKRVHYIGIQMTDSDSHRPTADNVRSFYVRHPKIVVAGADGLTPQQPSLTRVTPPAVQASTRVDSPAMQEASVDVLDKKVLDNVSGTRSMLYVKKYDGNNVSYQQLQSATDVPEDVARNWHTYAQYCCRVRDWYW